MEAVRPIRVNAVIAGLGAEPHTRRDAISDPARKLERQLLLGATLDDSDFDFLVLPFPLRFERDICRPHQAVVQEILLDDRLQFELELARTFALHPRYPRPPG